MAVVQLLPLWAAMAVMSPCHDSETFPDVILPSTMVRIVPHYGELRRPDGTSWVVQDSPSTSKTMATATVFSGGAPSLWLKLDLVG